MRTTLSLSVPKTEAKKAWSLAQARGFSTLSDYLRFLLSQDDRILISEADLVQRSKEASTLHRAHKLVRAESLADFLK